VFLGLYVYQMRYLQMCISLFCLVFIHLLQVQMNEFVLSSYISCTALLRQELYVIIGYVEQHLRLLLTKLIENKLDVCTCISFSLYLLFSISDPRRQ
jgi:hypothetical protein